MSAVISVAEFPCFEVAFKIGVEDRRVGSAIFELTPKQTKQKKKRKNGKEKKNRRKKTFRGTVSKGTRAM